MELINFDVTKREDKNVGKNDFTEYKQKDNRFVQAIFTGATFTSHADFSKATFMSFADFSNAVFTAGADFSNAHFPKGASFENAVFEPPAVGEEHHVTFREAQFGKPYQIQAGEWRIGFGYEDENYSIFRIKKGDKGWTEIERKEIDNLSDTSIKRIIKDWDLESHDKEIHDSFSIFRENPETISFKYCRFGKIDVDTVSKELVEEVVNKKFLREAGEAEKQILTEYYSDSTSADGKNKIRPDVKRILSRHLSKDALPKHRIGGLFNVAFDNANFFCRGDVLFDGTLFANGDDTSFDRASFANGGSASFDQASFANGGSVSFVVASFANGGSVSFVVASFANGGYVSFAEASFANGGSASFVVASFANGGYASFDEASFANGGSASFGRASFANGGYASFDEASFANGGSTRFDRVSFANDEDASFRGASFACGGAISFNNTLFANKNDVGFNSIKTKEDLDIKLYECLFLCGGKVSFANATFPAKKPTMFQRCHFALCPEVDFSGAVFRQTSFEGGEIGWIKEIATADSLKDKVPLERIFDNRDITIPERLKGSYIPILTNVFEGGVRVVWKDLTVESAKNLLFRLVNFSGAIFDGVTLKHIELNAPQWGMYRGRRILQAEKELYGKFNFFRRLFPNEACRSELRNIQNQYTQLKSNLEKYGDYASAGDFHYGEMEMRRKHNNIFQQIFTLTNIYRLSSGYGERPFRSLMATLTLLGGLMLLSYWAYYSPITEHSLNYINPETDSNFTQFVKILGHVLKPYSETLPAEGLNDKNAWYFFLLYFGKILLYLQTLMFALAVRRRFKR